MEEIVNLTDKYLEGSLDEEAESNFSSRLQNDPEFAATVGAYIQSRNIIREEARNQLRMKVGTAWQEYEQSGSESHQGKIRPFYARPAFWISGLAAAVVIILILIRPFGQSASPEDLFVAFYERPKMNMTFRSTEKGSQLDSLRRLATQMYDEGRYDDVEQIMNETEALREDVFSRYLFGVSMLEAGRYSEAIQHFEMVNTGTIRANAEWYRALAFLRNGDVEKAREAFLDLQNNPERAAQSPFRKRQIEEILEKLP